MGELDFWSALTDEVGRYRTGRDELPVMPSVTSSEIRSHLESTYSFDQPVDDSELIRDVARMLSEWTIHTPNRQYFGLFNPDTVPITIAADAMAAAFNPQLATWSHAPAPTEIETHTLGVFLRLLGFPNEPENACFTSGGSEANQSAVLAALTALFPGFAEDGVFGCDGQPVLYVSDEAHHSFVKIAHACGIGRQAVCKIPVDQSLRMRTDILAAAIESDQRAGLQPFMVIATGGTTSAGAIDPIGDIADVCAARGLWLHVDAAWGGAALLSDRLRGCLAGIERADSVTFDAHKWLSVPMGAGMFFCRDREVAGRTFGISTAYMPAKADAPDPYHCTLQWSRRFIGLKLFMAMASLGLDGYARQVEAQAAVGESLRTMLRERGWVVVNDSPFAVVCFTHPEILDGRLTATQILEKLYADRKSWISETVLTHHGSVLRACITNYRTDLSDVATLCDRLDEIVVGLRL